MSILFFLTALQLSTLLLLKFLLLLLVTLLFLNWCSPAVDFPFVARFLKFASVPTHVPFIAGFSKFVSVPLCCWIPAGTGVPAALDVPYIDATLPPPYPSLQAELRVASFPFYCWRLCMQFLANCTCCLYPVVGVSALAGPCLISNKG